MKTMKRIKLLYIISSAVLALALAAAPVGVGVLAFDAEGGIYQPVKSKDILINVDAELLDKLLACTSEQDLIDKLRAELTKLGVDDPDNYDFSIDNYNISLLRVELDATNTREWYVYDHTDTGWDPNGARAWWVPAQDGPWAGPSTKAATSGTNFINTAFAEAYHGNDGYNYAPLYGIPAAGRTTATIQAVNGKYGMNGFRLVWQLREHIYAYSTSKPGSDSKFANMIFSGYGKGNLVDFMYYPITEESFGTIEFDVNSAFVNDHSLFGTGFLINTGNTGAGGSGYQKGYLLYFRFDQDSDCKIKEVCLYKLKDNVTPAAIQGTSAQNTSTSKAEYFIANYLTKVGTSFAGYPTGAQSHWRITFSDTKINVAANNVGSDDIVEKEWALENTGFYGFGPLASYAGHGCARGTAFQFSDVLMATQLKDSFLNLKNAQFNTAADVDRYFINITDQEINEEDYLNKDNYWDTVNRLRSDEVFYLTNSANSLLDDGGKKPTGDLLDNGETFEETGDALIKALAKYIYDSRTFDTDFGDVPSGGSKPTAIFTLRGVEGEVSPSNPRVPLQAIEVKRIADDKPIEISALDTSSTGGNEDPIVEWVYTIKGPDGEVIKTVTFTDDHPPTDSDILLEITKDSPIGKYRVELVVKDDIGGVSDPLVRTFDVRSDDVPPAVAPGPASLTRNAKGEYEQAPQVFHMTDEGWGVIAYEIEYLDAKGEPLTDGGGEPYGTGEISLTDRMLALSVPNGADGLQGKYEIRVTVYDWAGNKTVESFMVNTLKADANDAIAALGDYRTTEYIRTHAGDLEHVEELLEEAKKRVADYVGDTGSAAGLDNYGYLAETEKAIGVYVEVHEFLDDYGDVVKLTLHEVKDENYGKIIAANDAYDKLSPEAKALLVLESEAITTLSALAEKVKRLHSISEDIYKELTDFEDRDTVNAYSLSQAKEHIEKIEDEFEDFLADYAEDSESDLPDELDSDAFEAYLRVKSWIASYEAALDYFDKHDGLYHISLGDIPKLPGAAAWDTVDELIEALEAATGEDYDGLPDEDARYYANPEIEYFRTLLRKAYAYRDARDKIAALRLTLGDALDAPVDDYAVLSAIIHSPEAEKRIFDEAVPVVTGYAAFGAPQEDLEDVEVYNHFRSAFAKYAGYLDYLEQYAGALALTEDTVRITDMAAIQSALAAYDRIGDPDVRKALEAQYDLLSALLAKDNELLTEYARIRSGLTDLIDGVNPYQEKASIKRQNVQAVTEAVDAIEELLERFIRIGGNAGDIPGYGVYLNVLDALGRYAPSWAGEEDMSAGYYPTSGFEAAAAGVAEKPAEDGAWRDVTDTSDVENLRDAEVPEGEDPLAEREPGGMDHDLPPVPNKPEFTVEMDEWGHFIEFNEEGAPLGEWIWNEELHLWEFDEYALSPLGFLPVTGEAGGTLLLFAVVAAAFTCFALGEALPWRARRRGHVKPR
ncbi:MAG: hypothetical protein FWG28_05145 [Clostridiales bacterium]|nr:hypothetical protein [Clostridiales bacterium]